MEGKFSLWFLAALALAEGNISLDKFTDERVNDERLGKLMRKVKAKLVRQLKLGANVVVKMKDGREYKKFLKSPKGSPENPMTYSEIAAKFENAAIHTLPRGNIKRLIEKINVLEEVDDISEIVCLTRSC